MRHSKNQIQIIWDLGGTQHKESEEMSIAKEKNVFHHKVINQDKEGWAFW